MLRSAKVSRLLAPQGDSRLSVSLICILALSCPAVLWKQMGCFNKAIGDFNREMALFADDYRRVISLPKDQKIHGICCRFLAFEERIVALAKKTCSATHSDYMIRFLKDYSSDVGDLLCAGITTKSESCKKLRLPPSVNGLQQPLEKTLSFIPPLLQILAQL